ncbi:nucleic acid-binding protein [Planococcus shixiaomingii]|uniref:nucleic acid-binding protein n=1 Tax=Planococcus shixiaomingii TaxID=3058393 RepID=UPI002618B01B|nr:nucleic acid-binding protein [Planococcus sp. N022]WKA56679.1 nucleic acid-binding protein [Planococcus sp. N022]
MKKICHQCQTDMIGNCKVSIEGAMYGIKISRKGQGLFQKAAAKPQAAVCPNCGYVALYIEEPEQFLL